MKGGFSTDTSRELRLVRVMDRYFIYNVATASHVELERREWHRLRRMGRGALAQWEGNSLITSDTGTCHVGHPSNCASLRHVVLQVASACNLRCQYCCADHGQYGHKLNDMSLHMARNAIDFLLSNTESSDLAVTYFGGEPLLNLVTVVDSAHYALEKASEEGKHISLHLVTNGVLLDFSTLQVLDRLGFSLTISLDGPAEHHDTYRPFPTGLGSYEKTIRALIAARYFPISSRTTIRGTFTRHSAYFFPILRYLADQGFARNISYEPVFLRRHPLAIRWADLPLIRRAYADVARYYVRRLKDRRAFCLWDMDDAITQLVLRTPRKSRCSAGLSTVAVTSEGDLYACHMSTGMPGAWVGNVRTGYDDQRRQDWYHVYMEDRPGCSDCWVRALCGGGCNTHALLYNDSLAYPYRLECNLIEWRYRLAMWVLAECPEIETRLHHAWAQRRPSREGLGHVVDPLWSYLEESDST